MAERILIIDDEELLRLNLKAMLERLGFEVNTAQDGREGLEMCARLRPDLVLLDARLPDLDGLEVCALLKQAPELREIPVIFLSGLQEAEDKVRAIEAGAVDYITKPYLIEEVRARLRVHLDLHRQRRELERSREQLEKSLFDTRMLNDKLVEINGRLAHSESVKSHFLSHMRNEVNNPLTVILGLADQIGRCDGIPERCAGMARSIGTEAFQLDFQLRNVFFAADLEAGELTPDYAATDIGSVLHDVAESFGHLSERKSVSVRILPGDPGEGIHFPSDASFLNVILANLLANAIEFSPPGGTVELQARLGDGALELSVQDEGPGVAETDQHAIFERFRQLDTGPTRSHLGQGLGLSVVKALVELMEGEIRTENPPGRGFRFSFSLPMPVPLESLDMTAFDGNLFLFGEAEEK